MDTNNKLAFEFDKAEAVHGSASLIPIYFDHHVLIKYFYHPRYRCEFASDTYGTIYGDDFYISFGINSNHQVLMWRIDVEALPEKEKNYLLTETIPPQYNIDSEFVEAQIDIKYTSQPLAIRCLNQITKLNKLFSSKFDVLLYKQDSIEEQIERAARYKRIMFNNQDDCKRFIGELNDIVNENVNNKTIKKLLNERGLHYKNADGHSFKGNKLLELVYKHILNDESNAISAFFYLYDLRLWASHSGNEDKYTSVLSSLGCSTDATYKVVLEAMLEAMLVSCEHLISIIENAG